MSDFADDTVSSSSEQRVGSDQGPRNSRITFTRSTAIQLTTGRGQDRGTSAGKSPTKPDVEVTCARPTFCHGRFRPGGLQPADRRRADFVGTSKGVVSVARGREGAPADVQEVVGGASQHRVPTQSIVQIDPAVPL